MSGRSLYCSHDPDRGKCANGEQQLRRLPVVDRDKRLVGIVSITDLAAGGGAAHSGAALGEIARPSGLLPR